MFDSKRGPLCGGTTCEYRRILRVRGRNQVASFNVILEVGIRNELEGRMHSANATPMKHDITPPSTDILGRLCGELAPEGPVDLHILNLLARCFAGPHDVKSCLSTLPFAVGNHHCHLLHTDVTKMRSVSDVSTGTTLQYRSRCQFAQISSHFF
jgi:hypothetical protein